MVAFVARAAAARRRSNARNPLAPPHPLIHQPSRGHIEYLLPPSSSVSSSAVVESPSLAPVAGRLGRLYSSNTCCSFVFTGLAITRTGPSVARSAAAGASGTANNGSWPADPGPRRATPLSIRETACASFPGDFASCCIIRWTCNSTASLRQNDTGSTEQSDTGEYNFLRNDRTSDNTKTVTVQRREFSQSHPEAQLCTHRIL